ncbi:MAG: nuclear transport factor 2 family protein [Planctomycetes bacterium]|nr:nuclear transport factor 2 family protein [Planctomycetota bacterium]
MSHVPILNDLYAKFATGDIPGVLALLDTDVAWFEAENNPYRPGGEPWHGPQAVLDELFMRLGGEWDGFGVTPLRYHDAGDSVIVEGRYSGTFLATGKSLDAQVCHVWTLRDGRITRFQQYVDTAQLHAVMGA